MKDPQSGLDAWRYFMQSEGPGNSIESRLPLILSGAGALGVLPFTVIRYMQGQWVAAVVDTVIVIGFLCLGYYVYRTHDVRFASIAISAVCVVGALTTFYVIGPNQIYWAYPAVLAIFYLLRPREAIALALLTVAALIPGLLNGQNSHVSTTVLITIVVMSSFAYAFALMTNNQRQQLIRLATKDPLTGAGNRRRMDDKLEEVVNSFARNGEISSMLLLDLDHFKKVNDIHGHAVGDQILKSLTEIVNLRIRVTDSLYRIGGEEFVVILEGQDLHHAAHLAEQLRTLVEVNELVPDQAVTISVGVAELKANETAEDWLHRADEAMYRAKDTGRNATSLSG